MARGTQHRKRRPHANARVVAPAPSKPARPKRPSWEDQLFFGRLRHHAKWMFVFLAAVFAVSFVIFGVGSGSSGISDILQNFFSGSSSSGPSLSALSKQTVEHPKSAKAWRDYATKLEQDQQDDAAITALTQYTVLKPKDQNALLELTGMYLRRAQDWDTIYVQSRAVTQALSPASTLQPKSTTKLGEAVASLPNPIPSAVSATTSTVTTNAYSKLIDYLSRRLGVYKQLAKLSPNDAITQYSLAQAAQDAGDSKTAIKAYKAFLKLAPSDSQAPTARKVLKQLEASVKASAAATSPGK